MSVFSQLMMRKKIPSIYKVLDWIQSSGTQYIDTGIIASGNTTVDLSYESVYDNQCVFNSRQSSNVRQFGLTMLTGGGRFEYAGNVGISGFNATANTKHRIVSKIENGNYIVENYNTNEELAGSLTFTQTSFTTPYSLILFARNNNGTINGFATNCKIYYFKLWDSGIPKLNMIPVRRTTDNVLGMYDTVSKTFFTNAGTGTFIGSDE